MKNEYYCYNVKSFSLPMFYHTILLLKISLTSYDNVDKKRIRPMRRGGGIQHYRGQACQVLALKFGVVAIEDHCFTKSISQKLFFIFM